MNDATAPDAAQTDLDAEQSPAGDVQPLRPSVAGLRVALLLGATTLAAAGAGSWTTVSTPGA